MAVRRCADGLEIEMSRSEACDAVVADGNNSSAVVVDRSYVS